MTRFSPAEDAVLEPFVSEPCRDWSAVMPRLPGRSRMAASVHLSVLRRRAGTLWTIPGGGYGRKGASA